MANKPPALKRDARDAMPGLSALSSLVYSTQPGRVGAKTCAQCRQALADCRCAALKAAVPAGDGQVRVSRENKGRGGKTVTLVRGLPLPLTELETLGKHLRSHCGSGGTVKDGVVEVQGDHAVRELAWLQGQGYSKAKRTGG